MSVLDAGVVATAEAVRAGRVRAPDLAREALRRAGQDPHRAFVHTDPGVALASAEGVQARLDAGQDPGLLAGVPIALKDNFAHQGQPLTCGSRALEGYVAPYTATVVRRLLAAGAIVVGRTNMDEFAMGSSTENSAWGPTANPWDPDRVPGGSSGGSAAAVAASQVPAALGSDTGGSVRQPAALCGVAGLKPTWGRLSRQGLVAFASSLDQPGPLARRVVDLARLLGVMAGPDPGDQTSSAAPPEDWEAACGRGVDGLRVGRVDLSGMEDLHPEVREGLDRAAAALEAAGARVEEVQLPLWSQALPCYYILAPAEASSNLARYDGIRYGPRAPAETLPALYTRTRTERLGLEVKRRILMGTFALSAGWQEAYHGRAQAVRDLLRVQTLEVLGRVDLLLLPTAPTPAFPLGSRRDDPVAMYLSDLFTVPASLAGIPAISVPAGPPAPLPAGVQLCGRPWDEATVLAAAAVLEAATGPWPSAP